MRRQLLPLTENMSGSTQSPDPPPTPEPTSSALLCGVILATSTSAPGCTRSAIPRPRPIEAVQRIPGATLVIRRSCAGGSTTLAGCRLPRFLDGRDQSVRVVRAAFGESSGGHGAVVCRTSAEHVADHPENGQSAQSVRLRCHRRWRALSGVSTAMLLARRPLPLAQVPSGGIEGTVVTRIRC
jgi:hypothetical protein